MKEVPRFKAMLASFLKVIYALRKFQLSQMDVMYAKLVQAHASWRYCRRLLTLAFRLEKESKIK